MVELMSTIHSLGRLPGYFLGVAGLLLRCGGQRMSLMDREPWFLSWLANGSWLIAAVLFGAFVGTPALLLEAPTLAWVVTLAVMPSRTERLASLAASGGDRLRQAVRCRAGRRASVAHAEGMLRVGVGIGQ